MICTFAIYVREELETPVNITRLIITVDRREMRRTQWEELTKVVKP